MSLERPLAGVLRLVRTAPGITRAALAERMGLSASSVNPLVARLVDEGLVEEVGAAPSGGRGRPSAGLRAVGPAETFGLLLWSHGVLDAVVLRFDGSVMHRARSAMDGSPDVARLVAACAELLDAVRRVPGVAPPQRLVLGLPAPYQRGVGLPAQPELDPDLPIGAMPRGHYAQWFDGDPVAELSERFGLPVVAVNDTNLAALGETRDGAARDGRCVVTVKLSARGVGSAITLHGNLFEGSRGFAGEIAHVRVDDRSTELCVCGSRGCLMGQLGPAMLRPLEPLHGPLDDAGLLALVDQGAPGPIRVLDDAAALIGRALADLAVHLDPDVIVLDAGSAAATSILVRGVEEQIRRSCPPFIRDGIAVRPSQLGEDAPLLGALHVARAAATQRSRRRSSPR